MSNSKELERIGIERIKEVLKEEVERLEKLGIERIKRKKLEIERIERETEKIVTQTLSKRHIKEITNYLNIKLLKESKEFILGLLPT